MFSPVNSIKAITISAIKSGGNLRLFKLFSSVALHDFLNNRYILFKVKPNLHSFLESHTKLNFSNMSDSEDKKAELKKRLTPLQYHVTQEKGTER